MDATNCFNLHETHYCKHKHILRNIWKISVDHLLCLCVFWNLSSTGLLCNYNINLCSTQRSNLRHRVEVFKGTSFLISPKREDYPILSSSPERLLSQAQKKQKEPDQQKQGNNQRQKPVFKKPKQNLSQSQKLRILQGVPLLVINKWRGIKYKPYKWPYKWVTGYIAPANGVFFANL